MRLTVTTAAAVIVVAMTGCGGGSSKGPATSSSRPATSSTRSTAESASPQIPKVDADVVAAEVTSQVKKAGVPVTGVTCDGDLLATVGATTNCTGTVNGQQKDYRAVVKRVRGKTVDFEVLAR